MSIPLVQNNEKDSINTSIIAIKKNLERINSLLGLADSSEPDLSGLATKQELEDAVTEINNTIDEVETSLQPVDAVTSGNMHSVTSNAVAGALAQKRELVTSSFYTSNTYSRNLALMAHAFFEGGVGNRDIALTGSLYYSYQNGDPRYLYAFDFLLSVRITSSNLILPVTFRVTAKDGNSQNVGDCFTATYKIGSDRRIDIYLYAKIKGTYNRIICIIDNLFYGDVYPLHTLPNNRLDMATSYIASIPSDQTVIAINSN